MDARNNLYSGRPRKHMGVATNDPDYLPPTGPAPGEGRAVPTGTAHRSRPASYGAKTVARRPAGNTAPHYERFLQTPKKGRAIFTSQQARQRQRIKLLLAVLILATVVLAVVWLFFLR